MGSWLLSFISDWKERFTPYKGWVGELKDPAVLKADAMAGLTVALISIPQSMAYAQLAGLPAYVGLYASFLPVMVAALFGSSRQLSSGPVAMASLMSATAIQPYAAQGVDAVIAYSAMLALMIGVFRLSLGLLRLGVVVDFLSHPVVLGFTNAGALIIATSQLPKIFGLNVKVDQFPHYYQFLWQTVISIPHTQYVTFVMGAFALLSLFVLKKYAKNLPGILITVVLTTVLSWAVGYEQMGGSVVGAIPKGLPSFGFPSVDMNFHNLSSLMVSAVVIGLMGLVEAISIAKAIASQTRQHWSVNQELVGQGLANITAGLCQGYVVSGSFSRSAVNFSSGALTGFASVVTGGLVAITLMFLTDLLYHLPQATLGAVIIIAVFNLFTLAPIKRAWRVERHDGIAAVVTFFAALIFAPHLEIGILSGVMLSLGLFLYRTMRPNFAEVVRHEDGTMRNAHLHGLQTSDNVAVYRFDGDLYFANTGYMEGKLLNSVATKPNLKVLILDMEGVGQVDATGDAMLEKMADRLRSTGIEFYFARTKLKVYEAFERSGLAAHIGEEHFFRERKYALQYAREKLGEAIDVTPFQRPLTIVAA
jgi:SulP family sulfate permease